MILGTLLKQRTHPPYQQKCLRLQSIASAVILLLFGLKIFTFLPLMIPMKRRASNPILRGKRFSNVPNAMKGSSYVLVGKSLLMQT